MCLFSWAHLLAIQHSDVVPSHTIHVPYPAPPPVYTLNYISKKEHAGGFICRTDNKFKLLTYGGGFPFHAGEIPNPPTYLKDYHNVFVTACGTGFYSQCLPRNTVNLAFCGTSVHWLSKQSVTSLSAIIIIKTTNLPGLIHPYKSISIGNGEWGQGGQDPNILY